MDGERVFSTKKKAWRSRSKIKVMLVVFSDWKCFVHHELVPRSQMVNKQWYREVLACMRDAVRRKRPELWETQTWMLHDDNAPTHASLFIRSYLAKHQTSAVPHSPYSLDLAPAEFVLFPKSKTTFERTSFPNRRGDSGKCNKKTTRHHRTCFPGSIPTMEETLGTVYRQ